MLSGSELVALTRGWLSISNVYIVSQILGYVKVNEIIRSIGKRNPNLFPDGERKVHFEINNPEYKFLCVDINVESK
ncbi:hypothetical protein FEK48_20680 [Escherichia sp. E2593]|nr:hypothetical protein D9738_20795 [Escherichia sp. E10V5]TGB72746.1 hypothetical protein CRG96_00530 [Escherichia sp. E4930]TGB81017.1 hypothetical protein CRI65_25040 [Escherichia sp. E3659]TGC05419.1 hypothetical protein CRG93_24825 [Escherichia sp. E2593]TLI78105.1 hypothetical protein FEK48_20680 [Escherichia sp. E2593]